MELKTVFIDNDSDMKCLDTISKSLSSDILEKAFDKSKLTQKEITDKNGNRRKVWVKAGEDQKQSKPSKKDEDSKDSKPSKSSVDFTLPSHGDTKKAIIELASKHSKQDIMNSAKQQGITWKENSHEGINWMRASMAIQKAMKNGTIKKVEQPKVEPKKVETTKKAEQPKVEPKKADDKKVEPKKATKKADDKKVDPKKAEKVNKARDLLKKLLNTGKIHLDSTEYCGEPVKDVTIAYKDQMLEYTDKRGNRCINSDMSLETASQLISSSVGITEPVVVDNSKKDFLRSSDLSSHKHPDSAERAEKIVEHVIHELNQTNKNYTFLVKTETELWGRDVTKRHCIAVVPKAKSVDDIDLSSIQNKFYGKKYTFIGSQRYSDQLANDQGSMTEVEFKQHLVDKINSYVNNLKDGKIEPFSKNTDRTRVLSGLQKL